MATIKKSLSTKKDGQGYSQILFRVSIDKNKKLRLRSGIYIPENRWDAVKERMSYGKAIGAERGEMTDKEAKLKNIEAKLLKLCEVFPKETLSKEWVEDALLACENIESSNISAAYVTELIEHYQNPDQYKKVSLFKLLADFRNNAKKKVNGKREGNKSDVWKKNFDVLIRALHRYEYFIQLSDSKRKDFTLDIDTIDKNTLEDIESYLRNEHTLLDEYPKIFEKFPANTDTKRKSPKPQPRGNNTISAMLKRLKSFINWAIEKRITANNPFIDYEGTISQKYGTPYYITLDERNQIADFDLSNRPTLAVQRDIFIFQCCIGCRVSDLMRLTESNIIDGAIEYIPTKTKEERQKTVRIPLNSRALEILNRYKGRTQKNLILPFISSQKYNDAIKEIFTVCGITRNVTVVDSVTGKEIQRPINEVASSHMARRCFVGNLYQKVQDPNLIASMSGHAEGSKAFARYRAIDDKVKKEVIKLID